MYELFVYGFDKTKKVINKNSVPTEHFQEKWELFTEKVAYFCEYSEKLSDHSKVLTDLKNGSLPQN